MSTNTEYYIQWYARNGRKRSVESIASGEAWAKRNKDKKNAASKLYRAVKNSKITRPEVCSTCSRKTKLQGHHEDYDKPLDVVWLCASCHKKLHNEKSLHF